MNTQWKLCHEKLYFFIACNINKQTNLLVCQCGIELLDRPCTQFSLDPDWTFYNEGGNKHHSSCWCVRHAALHKWAVATSAAQWWEGGREWMRDSLPGLIQRLFTKSRSRVWDKSVCAHLNTTHRLAESPSAVPQFRATSGNVLVVGEDTESDKISVGETTDKKGNLLSIEDN